MLRNCKPELLSLANIPKRSETQQENAEARGKKQNGFLEILAKKH